MRKEYEDALLAADAAGLIRGAILKLPDFYGPHVERSFLHSASQAAVIGKRAQLVGSIDTPHEFVFVPDVGPPYDQGICLTLEATCQSSAATR